MINKSKATPILKHKVRKFEHLEITVIYSNTFQVVMNAVSK